MKRACRPALTLIELLIVMCIIGLLLGMLLPAIQIARRAAYKAQAISDVSQLSLAVAHTKDVNNSRYLPNFITIKSQYDLTQARDAYDWGQLVQFYGPRFGTKNPMTPTIMMSGLPDWGLIQGSQCLVLFLGGWNGTSFTTGQAQNVTNPFVATGSRSTFFDFPPNRLWLPPGSAVPVFVDPFPAHGMVGGTPYAYLTSINGNDYNANPYCPLNPANPLLPNPSPTGQCDIAGGIYTNFANPALAMTIQPTTLMPFVNVTGQYVNFATCQIISAGADSTFGPGGTWKPGTAPYVNGLPGADDYANFWATGLGVPNN